MELEGGELQKKKKKNGIGETFTGTLLLKKKSEANIW